MSTKTTTKRLALATVVAVGAGLLSIVSVSSANAAPAGGVLAIDSTGASDGLTAIVSATSSQRSVNVVKMDGALLLQTGVASTGAHIAANFIGTANSAAGILVTGGTIETVTVSTGSFKVTGGTYVSTSTVADVGILVAPNAGATKVTIQGYDNVGVSSGASATAPTGGTLMGQALIDIVPTTTSGTVSTSKSGIFYMGTVSLPWVYTPIGGTISKATIVDRNTAGVGTTDFNTNQTAAVLVRDAYGNKVTTGALITVSATNGAYVGLNNTSQPSDLTQDVSASTTPSISSTTINTTAGTQSNDYKLSTAVKYYGLTVSDPTSAPLTTVVTVSVNGTVIGTKAFTFTGKVAKVTLGTAKNGKVGGKGTVSIAYYDAAGNKVTADKDTPLTPYVNTVVQGANTAGLGITVVGTLTDPTYVADHTATGTKYDTLEYNCPSSNATGNVAVDYTNPLDGTVVSSNQAAVTCSGAPDTYTAAFDKKSYVAGDIATLTVTFKDSKGAIAADIAAGTAGAITNGSDTSTATNVPSVTGSQLTIVGAPTKSDATTNGVVTYKFVIGTTAGSYQAVVSFPQVNANANGAAQSAAYAVTDGGGTSLNDVLKGIVSLIASINKQIAALAKLVTKK